MMSASVAMVMVRDIQIVLLTGVVVSVFSAVVIPDKVMKFQLDYVSRKASWHQHNAACRSNGGFLVLLEDPITTEILNEMDAAVGGMSDFFTRAVIRSDNKAYTHDDVCRSIDMSLWTWTSVTYDSAKQCTITSGADYAVGLEECTGHNHEAICQYNAQCQFQSTSVSLASLPVSDANMSVCQDTCRQIIGCFATAPSGHATLPPYTHCLFIITGDSFNPMTTLDCSVYTMGAGPNPQSFTDPSKDDPPSCTPSPAASDDVWPMTDFLKNATASVACTETSISVSTVVDTITTTFTRPAVTDYITVPTLEIVTTTITPTQSLMITYVTVAVPTTVDQTVTVTADRTVLTTVDHTVTTTRDYTVPTTVDQIVTVTADRIVPTTVDQTITVTADRIVPTTVDQTITVTVDRTVLTTVDQTITVTVDPSEPCSATTSSTNARPQGEVYVDIESMVKELTVVSEVMSKQRRKKESASDERRSAQTIGTLAIVFLTLVGLFIVGIDLMEVYQDIMHLKASVKVSSEETMEAEEEC